MGKESVQYDCAECGTYLSSTKEIISKYFRGSTGPAYFFNKVENTIYGDIEKRDMITGVYHIRDVFCKGCDAKLGWIYDEAENEDQKGKEGRVVLECLSIKAINMDTCETSSGTSADSAIEDSFELLEKDDITAVE